MMRAPRHVSQTEETAPEGLIGQGWKSAPPAEESIFRKMGAYASRKGEEISQNGREKVRERGEGGRAEPQRQALKLGHKAQEAKQPGDGSCMYHGIAFGLNRARSPALGDNGPMLRQVAAQYLEKHAGDILPGGACGARVSFPPTRLRFPERC